jgi:molybdopterin-guanine dinucleotide biosynthesis protein A
MAANPKEKAAPKAMFDKDEQAALEAIARRRGFTSVRQYVLSLVANDAEQHHEAAPIVADELDDPVEGLKQALLDVKAGRLLTEEEFWKAVADDD